MFISKAELEGIKVSLDELASRVAWLFTKHYEALADKPATAAKHAKIIKKLPPKTTAKGRIKK